jgi:hypothetical protein
MKKIDLDSTIIWSFKRVQIKETKNEKYAKKNCDTLLDVSVSSLRRGHANLLCIVPILADDPRGVPINIGDKCLSTRFNRGDLL